MDKAALRRARSSPPLLGPSGLVGSMDFLVGEVVKRPLDVFRGLVFDIAPYKGRLVMLLHGIDRQSIAPRYPPKRRREPTTTPLLRQQAVDAVHHAARRAPDDDQTPVKRLDEKLLRAEALPFLFPAPSDALLTHRAHGTLEECRPRS